MTDVQNSENIKKESSNNRLSENITEKISAEQNSDNIIKKDSEDKEKENCEECTDADCPPNEEKELCDGEACPTVQNKKILSLKEGLADLDKILASLQGLCEDSSCPFNKNAKSGIKPNFNNGDIKENVKKSFQLKENCGGETCPDVRKDSTKNLVFGSVVAKDKNNALCKDPICYSAYMGYKFTPVQKTFDYSTSSPLSYNVYNTKYENSSTKKDYNWDLNTKVPCGGSTCPYTSANVPEPASTSYQFSNGKYNFRNRNEPAHASLQNKVSPDLNTTNIGPCDNITCPITTNYLKTEPVDLCGRPSCPYTSIGNTPNQNVLRNNLTDQPNTLDCGEPTCPFSKTAQQNLLTGLATGIFPSGNSTCPNQTTNIGAKQYHCGSPSCTNLNPSSMIYTHYYANDYGFIQEAARPYCGSASPYDYLSSINNKYPTVLASNYPTFNNSNFTGSVPCPYLSNKDGRAKMDKDEEDGICGGGKTNSCDHPDVEKCESPDCKMTNKTSNLKNFLFCEDCGGVKFEQKISEIIKSAESISDTMNCNNTQINKVEEKTMVQKLSEKVVMKSNDSAMKFAHTNGKKKISKEESVTIMTKKNDKKPVLYTYPGIQIGHKDCLMDMKQVPGNMGWLWNILPQGNKELWRGYKPGAVSRTVHRMMRAHKKSLNILDSSSDVIRKKKSKTKTTVKPEDMKHYVEVKKKDGDYYVIVNPVRDPETIGPTDDPFMDVTPMQFKIEKKEEKKEEAYCPCDEVNEKPCPSSASSEMEFVFSPPAAIPPVRAKKKIQLQEIDTQYDVNDLPVEFSKSSKDVGQKKGGKKGKKDGKGKGNKEAKAKKKKK